MAKILFTAAICYLIGAIPTGYLVGRFLKEKNIQEEGSGNIGTFNALEVLGTGPGLLVFVGDLGKAFLALAVAKMMGLSISNQWWMGLATVLGHIYPVYLRFRGGKGLATSLGIIMALDPVTIPLFLVPWIISYLFTRHVATSSVLALAGVTIHLGIIGVIPGLLGGTVIICRHLPEALAFVKEKRQKRTKS